MNGICIAVQSLLCYLTADGAFVLNLKKRAEDAIKKHTKKCRYKNDKKKLSIGNAKCEGYERDYTGDGRIDDSDEVIEQKKKSEVSLPAEMSFLRSEGSAIVTAFKAGGAPMASMKGDLGDINSRGVTVRCFEPDGVCGETRQASVRLCNSQEA